jgi:hypothetical protein
VSSAVVDWAMAIAAAIGKTIEALTTGRAATFT